MINDTNFSGQRVLVVGGSSGIGNGVAHAFRQRGAEVHVWGTRASAADYDGIEGSDLAGLHYACVDVADPDQIERAPQPGGAGATLDVLVLCQGTVAYKRAEFEREGWDRVMAINLDSLMHCCRRFKPALLPSAGREGGKIIIVSSIAGLGGSNVGNPAYAASKAGAMSLVRTLGVAWAPDGIRVNGMAPGLVDTKLTKITTQNPKRLEGALANIPMHRLGTPADMAGAVLFLASPLGAYMAGQNLNCDGGLSLAR
ncbi:MAG TPA: SDR family NAD(P)-dependent oxidoreductase [Aquabacterium sp.]|nr:SDR family NAD(P)-dependent oxidoreductase [Aquabacterium sp.]HQC95135.1 SDR family NAD(P)-dependent oxidoreductase [Aquabacterium sp.]